MTVPKTSPYATAADLIKAGKAAPGKLTFASGGQGLWSTLDDYLAFARMLIGDGPPIVRPSTLRTMTSNQLTPDQRASARLFGQTLFAAGHGWRFAELDGRRGSEAIQLAFRDDFPGDRVLALVAGLGGMVWMGIGAFIMSKMISFEI